MQGTTRRQYLGLNDMAKADASSTRTRSGSFAWMESLLLRHRLTFNIVTHAVIFTLALLLAHLVRFEVAGAEARGLVLGSFLPMLPVFVIVKLIIFGATKLFRGGWQYASIRDVGNHPVRLVVVPAGDVRADLPVPLAWRRRTRT